MWKVEVAEEKEMKRSNRQLEPRTGPCFRRLSLSLLAEVTNSICTRQSTPGWRSRVLNYRRVDLASEREMVSFAPRSRDRGRRAPRSIVS